MLVSMRPRRANSANMGTTTFNIALRLGHARWCTAFILAILVW